MSPPSCQTTYFDYCRMGICIDCSHPGTHESYFLSMRSVHMNPASSVATTFAFFGMLLIWPDQDHPWSFVSVKRQTGFSCSISISCPHLHEHAATSSRLIRWDECGLMFCVLSCGLSSIYQEESCWALSSHLYICRHFLTWKQLIERCLMFFSFPKALKHSRLVCSDLRNLHDWGYQDLPMCLLARNKQHYSKTWANIICETCLVEFPSLWTGFYFEALHHWQDLAECLTQSLIDVILAHPQYGVQFVKTYFFNVVVCISVYILIGHMQRLVTPFV